jgi:hypothetical protein
MPATIVAVQSVDLPGHKITFQEMDDGNGNYVYLNNLGNIHLLMKNGLSGGAAVKAHGTITSSEVQVTDGKIITIDAKTYTFKTTLTPTEGQVLIGTDYSDTLVHLKAAINHTGTPDVEYKCAIAHPTVEATTLTSAALTVEARTAGVAGNDLVLTSDETTYTLDPADGSLHGGAAATTNIIVTIAAPGLCSYGESHSVPITIPEGETWDSGYLTPPRRFQDSNRYVQITYTGATPDANCLIAAIAQA